MNPKVIDRDERCTFRPGLLARASLFGGLLGLGACEASPVPASASVTSVHLVQAAVKPEQTRVWMTVGARRFVLTLTDSEAGRAFAALLPLTLDMPDLNANEKHVELPTALPTNASRPGTIRSGDLMLYGSRTLVLFYLNFDSAYAYTRLGRVDDAVGLTQALGPGSARIVFSKD